MPSTFTDSLRLEQQGQGENSNTWGLRLNQTIDAIDEAVAGSIDVALTSGDVVLTVEDNDDDQARNRILRLTGTLTGNSTVEVPEVSKEYVIWDLTTRGGFTIDLRLGSAGNTATVAEGRVSHFVTDGTDWAEVVPLGTADNAVRTNSQNDARFLLEANNLSDLANFTTARSNLSVLQAGTGSGQARTNSQNDARFVQNSDFDPTAPTLEFSGNIGSGVSMSSLSSGGPGWYAVLLDATEALNGRWGLMYIDDTSDKVSAFVSSDTPTSTSIDIVTVTYNVDGANTFFGVIQSLGTSVGSSRTTDVNIIEIYKF